MVGTGAIGCRSQAVILEFFVLVSIAYANAQGDEQSAEAPKVGECAKRDGSSDDMVRVDCSDSAATYRVTSKHSGTTDGDTACAGDSAATSYYSFDSTSHGLSVSSFVLCLADS